VLNAGDASYLAAVRNATQRSRCLRMVALGGSVTCGVAQDPRHTDRPAGKHEAWPAWLTFLLNQRLPCDGGDHKMDNLCVSGAASDYWVTTVAALRSQPAHAIMRADLIVVDTAVNDVEELAKSDNDYLVATDPTHRKIKKYCELLLALLRALPLRPSVVWLGSSTRGQPWVARGDAAHAHAEVMRHYGAPHVGAVDALGPFDTEEKRRWFTAAFRADACCHASKYAHKVMALLLAHLIVDVHLADLAAPWFAHEFDATRALPPPLVASASDLRMYLESTPLHVSTASAAAAGVFVKHARGWAFGEDRRGKPGLISHNVSDAVDFDIAAALVERHVRSGQLDLALLKTYEHAGTLNATVWAMPGAECGGVPRTVASVLVDCMWAMHVSETSIVSISFDAAAARGGCLRVSLEVVSSLPLRAVNKVKLIGFTLY
jgi:hypothetical protein